MLTSPQTLTIDTVDIDCDKITSERTASTYANSDGTVSFKVSHQESKNRTRHMARLDKTVVASDPLTAESAYQRAGVYIVLDEPIYGFSNDDIADLVDALKTKLDATFVGALLSNRH